MFDGNLQLMTFILKRRQGGVAIVGRGHTGKIWKK